MTIKELFDEIMAVCLQKYKATSGRLKIKDMPYNCKDNISRLITVSDGKKTKRFLVHISEVTT